MSPAPQALRPAAPPGPAARPLAPRPPAAPVVPAWRQALDLGGGPLARVGWSLSRTGRSGLLGLGLLLASALFLLSTQRPVAEELETLQRDVEAARRSPRPSGADREAAPAQATLPGRAEVPALLGEIFDRAARDHLAVDTGTYRGQAAGGGLVRTRVTLPVVGAYPQIRSFLDGTLASMPAVALSGLALRRRAIGDRTVEAEVQLTLFTAGEGTRPPTPAVRPGRALDAGAGLAGPGRDAAVTPPSAARVAASGQAPALFAPHSWYVKPPPPPPPPPAPAPEPRAPPFPYALVGSYEPRGDPPVYFLKRGDQLIDARVGDRIDGVYQFESAAGGQLVFVYLPLKVRHVLAAGGAK